MLLFMAVATSAVRGAAVLCQHKDDVENVRPISEVEDRREQLSFAGRARGLPRTAPARIQESRQPTYPDQCVLRYDCQPAVRLIVATADHSGILINSISFPVRRSSRAG